MKKKLYLLLIILIILILILKLILGSSSNKYKIKTDEKTFEIEEKKYDDNIYINIDNKFSFRIYKEFDDDKIIEKIYYYKDSDYECILPIIDGKNYTDIMCINDKIIYNYHTIKNNNTKLDKFVSNIEEYNINNYEDDINNKNIGTIKYNLNGIKSIVSMTNYRGLIIDSKDIELFTKDIYKNNLSTYINKYYFTVNYNKKYNFDTIYLVDLTTKEVNDIKTNYEISYDSYIQGIVDNSIYLYDIDNETQYEVNIDNMEVTIVSDDNYVKYYKNNKWEKLNKKKANKEIYFDYTSLDNKFPKYDYVIENTNNYYLFKKDGVSYKLYYVDKEDEIYKYIMTIPTTNISYKNNFIYYVYKDKLYYYSDTTGKKTLIENSELEFNDSIKYYIY